MKYTDEQIKKALELCINWEAEYCEKCPFDDECENAGDIPLRNALDLINRLQAQNERDVKVKVEALYKVNDLKLELERLNKDIEGYKAELESEHLSRMDNIRELMSQLKTVKSEAIKEFAKDIKSYIDAYVVFEYAAGEEDLLDYIDNLVEEMVGESK